MKIIYFMKNDKNEIIYIGKTKNLNKRLYGHKLEKKKDDWYSEVKSVEYVSYNNNYIGDIMEIYYIGKYKPIHNIDYIYEESLSIDLSKYEKTKLRFNYEEVDFNLKEIDSFDKNFFKKFKIYEGKLNEIGENRNSICDKWFQEQANVAKIKKNIYNYFKTKAKTKYTENVWTCTDRLRDNLKGDGYTRGWLNIYNKDNKYNIKSIAFISNIFTYNKNIKEDEDLYALKVLLNFLYNFKTDLYINLYIPSKRMRGMLREWLSPNN